MQTAKLKITLFVYGEFRADYFKIKLLRTKKINKKITKQQYRKWNLHLWGISFWNPWTMGPVCQLSSHWPPHSSPVISISHMSWTPITHISISAECSKDVEKVAKHHNRPICKGLFWICVKSSRGWRENRSKEEDWNNLSFESWWKKGGKNAHDWKKNE